MFTVSVCVCLQHSMYIFCITSATEIHQGQLFALQLISCRFL